MTLALGCFPLRMAGSVEPTARVELFSPPYLIRGYPNGEGWLVAGLCRLALGPVVTSTGAFTFRCPRLPLSPTFVVLPRRLPRSPLLSRSTQMTWRASTQVDACVSGDRQRDSHRSPGEVALKRAEASPSLPGRRGLLPDPKPEMLHRYQWESWGSWRLFLPSCCRTSRVFPGSWCLLLQGVCTKGMKY